MADESTPDFTVDRSGPTPVRKDNRGMLHMLHDEIGKALGIGRAKDVGVQGQNGQHQGVMEAVDDAVTGAKGANPDY